MRLTLYRRLRSWLEGDAFAFSATPLSPEGLARLRRAQAEDIYQSSGAATAGAFAGATFVVLCVWRTPACGPLLIWLGFYGLYTLTFYFDQIRVNRAVRDKAELPAGYSWRTTAWALWVGTLWGFAGAVGFAVLPPDQRAPMAMLLTATLCSAVLHFATHLPSVYALLFTMIGGAVLGLLAHGGADGLLPCAIYVLVGAFSANNAHRHAFRLARRMVAHAAAERASLTDPLTGLANRAAFDQKLAAAFQVSAASGRGFAVLSVDLNHFKDVNDNFGHAAGDALLCAVGGRLEAAAPAGDVVARLGGDEFAILLADSAEAATVASGVASALTVAFDLGFGRYIASASVGVAVAPVDGEDVQSLLETADRAMYAQKAVRPRRKRPQSAG